MPVVNLPGVAIQYELSGRSDRPVLLLSNSLGTSLSMWEQQLPAFEQDFQILRYDMRGHGASSTPADPYSIAMLGQDVLALLDTLNIATVDFCGISIGGVIGQWIGVHASDRLRKLVVCNTAAKIGTDDGWDQRIEQVRKGGMESVADAVLSRWFTPEFFQAQPGTIAAMRSMLLRTSVEGYVNTCAAIRDMDLRASIGQIRTPVCVVAGERDLVTTVADAVWLHESISASTLATVPAAHISNVEAADIFNATVLDFLR